MFQPSLPGEYQTNGEDRSSQEPTNSHLLRILDPPVNKASGGVNVDPHVWYDWKTIGYVTGIVLCGKFIGLNM